MILLHYKYKPYLSYTAIFQRLKKPTLYEVSFKHISKHSVPPARVYNNWTCATELHFIQIIINLGESNLARQKSS